MARFPGNGDFGDSAQGGVGDHTPEQAADLVVPASVASAAAKIAKEPLHDVVGALGLDAPGCAGSPDSDRIGKERVLIFIDWFERTRMKLRSHCKCLRLKEATKCCDHSSQQSSFSFKRRGLKTDPSLSCSRTKLTIVTISPLSSTRQSSAWRSVFPLMPPTPAIQGSCRR